jgi:kynureninase
VNLAQLTRQAEALDAADPIAAFRAQFALPRDAAGQPLVYLCGHSLGLAPLAASTLVNEELDDWARRGVRGHHDARRPWIEYAGLLQPGLAALVGAEPSEVVAMNSLTVNLHLLLASFYAPRGTRRRILIEAGAFSSDWQAISSQIAWHGLQVEDALIEVLPDPGDDLVDEAQVERLLAERGTEIALVLWPGVQYRTGQAFDLGRIARAAHAAGAVCGFDLAHAVGNLPLRLHDDGADFAVWCGYKYLNGGPGAIGGAFVHSRHRRDQLPGLAGWWGHDPATRFRMESRFDPAAGAAGWQVSNPPIFSAAPLLASLQLFHSAGFPALRRKSLRMDALLREFIEGRLGGLLHCLTPSDPARHGCQLSLRVRAGRAAGRHLFEQLEAQGAVVDWREPDILRVAPVPLYNRFDEIARLCAMLERVLQPTS